MPNINPYHFTVASDSRRDVLLESKPKMLLQGICFGTTIGVAGTMLTLFATAAEAQRAEHKAILLIILVLHISLGASAGLFAVFFNRIFGFLPSRIGIFAILLFSFCFPLLGVALTSAIHNGNFPVAMKQKVLSEMLLTSIPLCYAAGLFLAVLRASARRPRIVKSEQTDRGANR